MMKKALIAAIAFSFATFAVAQQAAPAKPSAKPGVKPSPFAEAKAAKAKSPDCAADATECTITITVGKGCAFKMSHDVYVVARHEKGVEMVWKLEGAEFAKKNPIDFKAGDFKPMKRKGYTKVANPKGVFRPSSEKIADSDHEHHKFNSGKEGQYYYTVNVVQDGKACKEYDPGVINQ